LEEVRQHPRVPNYLNSLSDYLKRAFPNLCWIVTHFFKMADIRDLSKYEKARGRQIDYLFTSPYFTLFILSLCFFYFFSFLLNMISWTISQICNEACVKNALASYFCWWQRWRQRESLSRSLIIVTCFDSYSVLIPVIETATSHMYEKGRTQKLIQLRKVSKCNLTFLKILATKNWLASHL